ncbi:MAG: 5-demethoxyubiquinol-8 5-hydroxylase UbiM [Alphaproteobacteria bacterium]|nr:5-demethoxyubiquinol-8 5-hydroxylase UbiM [Alphaproteobacteria bacterium]
MAKKSTNSYDVIVIGAGPAGLSFARDLADTGLRICILEKQPASVLAAPPLDGRDIALTHDSMALMRELGMWEHLPKDEISPIRAARVFSSESSYFLGFDSAHTGKKALGCLVPNNQIRRASYLAVKKWRNVTIRDKTEVKKVSTDEARGTVALSSGEVLTAPLIVAADSRFSASRAQMGVPVTTKDFGRWAIVCRMTHEKAHGEIAQECFFDAWTLAILPLQNMVITPVQENRQSSIVITLPTSEAEAVMKMPLDAFNKRIEQSLGDRLGKMRLIGERYSYPLVAVYASTFAAQRYALIGDAAVGMHPVTAHGYNLGLAGAHRLATEIRKALSLGIDIGDSTVLDAYARDHRRASAFLYYGTNALVNVYTDNRPAVLALRALGLRIADKLPPFKKYVTKQLTGKAA